MKRVIVPAMVAMMFAAGAAYAQSTAPAVNDPAQPSATTTPANPATPAVPAMKDAKDQTGYIDNIVADPNLPTSTIAQVKEMDDKKKVVIRGELTDKNDDGSSYTLKDSTDTIDLKVDTGKWKGMTFGKGDMVEVGGELDKGLISSAINVQWMKKQ